MAVQNSRKKLFVNEFKAKQYSRFQFTNVSGSLLISWRLNLLLRKKNGLVFNRFIFCCCLFYNISEGR